MKKIILICLTVLMLATFTVSAFASTGGFVSSPSGNDAPKLESGENESDECVAEIIITSYADRNDMAEESRQEIEEAYAEIIGTQDLSSLSEKIKEVADERDIDVANLAVSDLFDITETFCEGHEDHGYFNIVLSAETLKNFVCLLHYYNGEWVVVDNAKVVENGENLEFSVDSFSPFAIVVSTAEEEAVEPDTGVDTGDDGSDGFEINWLLIIIIAILVLVLLFLL